MNENRRGLSIPPDLEADWRLVTDPTAGTQQERDAARQRVASNGGQQLLDNYDGLIQEVTEFAETAPVKKELPASAASEITNQTLAAVRRLIGGNKG